ncbi:MAG: LemA family protein [Clostridia bacterium]|nr:LemA family protein [Clostridia bacterium]
MKKTLILVLVIVAIVGIFAVIVASTYNGFVSAEENLKSVQAQVGVQLQRRADLIPNFVATVKGYTEYEKSTLTAVTEARASVGKAKTVTEQEAANTELDKAIDVWVNAVTEAYPDLKADKQYIALQDELAGTENRVATARKDYNTVAESYNKRIRSFPSNIIAKMFGFDKADYFTPDDTALMPPVVDFS